MKDSATMRKIRLAPKIIETLCVYDSTKTAANKGVPAEMQPIEMPINIKTTYYIPTPSMTVAAAWLKILESQVELVAQVG